MDARRHPAVAVRPAAPAPAAVLELLKPITWFAPMWAFGCGVVSSGVPLAGPLAAMSSPASCSPGPWSAPPARRSTTGSTAMSTPSTSRTGRSPRAACPAAGASTSPSAGPPSRSWSPPLLGPWGFGAAVVGLALAWAYSAPPIRLKRNGWWGNSGRRRLLRGPALVHRRRGHGRVPGRTGGSSLWPPSTASARTAS